MTENTEQLGATGEFPKGKIHPHDEGELQMGFATADNRVVIEFGKPVKWLGMTAGDARRMADLLVIKADILEPGPERTSRAFMLDIAEYFEARAEEEHTKAMDAKEVTQVSIYAGREQIWREAAQEIQGHIGLEDEDEPDDEKENGYVDEIDFEGKVEAMTDSWEGLKEEIDKQQAEMVNENAE